MEVPGGLRRGEEFWATPTPYPTPRSFTCLLSHARVCAFKQAFQPQAMKNQAGKAHWRAGPSRFKRVGNDAKVKNDCGYLHEKKFKMASRVIYNRSLKSVLILLFWSTSDKIDSFLIQPLKYLQSKTLVVCQI